MPKYNKRVVKRICDLLSKDSYTVSEICSLSGISETTYYEWQATKAEFSEAVSHARFQFDELLVKEAKNSLRKKVLGYEVEETKVVYVNHTIKGEDGKEKQVPRIKEQTTVKKHFQPDTAAIVFALTNKAPEEWKNRQNNEVTGKDGKDLFAGKSDEELNARIEELEKKLKG